MKPENLLDELVRFAKESSHEKDWTYAIALTKSGKVLKSVFVTAFVDSACLCAETGNIVESVKLKDPITYSLCIRYLSDEQKYIVLPACGVCQERLAPFGMDVMIGVPENNQVVFKSLSELRPYFWMNYFKP